MWFPGSELRVPGLARAPLPTLRYLAAFPSVFSHEGRVVVEVKRDKQLRLIFFWTHTKAKSFI